MVVAYTPSVTDFIINILPVFILLIVFIIVVGIYLICDGCLCRWWNTYFVQVQSVWVFRQTTSKIANWVPMWKFRIFHCHQWPTPPPPFKDIFSVTTEESVPDSVSVSSNDQKTGGAGGWLGIFSSVFNAPTTSVTTVIYTSLSWDCRLWSPYLLGEFMVRGLNFPKCVLRLIVGFLAVDACVRRPFLAKSCF